MNSPFVKGAPAEFLIFIIFPAASLLPSRPTFSDYIWQLDLGINFFFYFFIIFCLFSSLHSHDRGAAAVCHRCAPCECCAEAGGSRAACGHWGAGGQSEPAGDAAGTAAAQCKPHQRYSAVAPAAQQRSGHGWLADSLCSAGYEAWIAVEGGSCGAGTIGVWALNLMGIIEALLY